MTSEKALWAVQTAFDGGIQQQPETAAKNSVMDALNVWTPQSKAERRPGYASFPGIASPVSPTLLVGTGTLFDPSGNLLQTGNIQGFAFPSSVAAGSTFVVTYGSVGPGTAGLAFTGTFPAFMLSVVGVQTKTRGVIILDAVRTIATTTNYGTVYVLPSDTLFGNTTPFPIQITFFITVAVTTSPVITAAFPYIQLPQISNVGLSQRIEYNSGTRYLRYRFGTFSQSDTLTAFSAKQTFLSGFFPNAGTVSPYEFPPQVAVVPEIDTAYFVLGGATVTLRKADIAATGKANATFATTQDGTIVGVPPTAMACYGTFPGGSQIINFRSHLFANGSAQNNQQNILFWNYGNLSQTISGAIVDTTNIWPVTAFAALSDARDNSEITALFPVGDNLGVSKKNSIWLAVLAQAATPGAISGGVVTQNAVLVDQFSVELVVPGIGFLAPGSVQAIPGGLFGLSEDAFYLFDGTPNIKARSYVLQDYVDRINPGRKSYAQGINWRTQRMYFCAVSLDDNSTTNDTVLAWDYQSDAWWVFQGRNKTLDITNWLIIDGVGFKEELWFQDSAGQLNKFIGDTDYGIPIDSYIVTQRFGEFDIQGRDVTEVRTQSINNQQNIVQPSLQLLVEDIPVVTQNEADPGATTKPVNFPLSGEVLWSQPPVSGTSTYAPTRRRERKTPVTGSGYWFQAKIMNLMQYIAVAFGYIPNGRR